MTDWQGIDLIARQQVDCRRFGLHQRAFLDLLIEQSFAWGRFQAIFPSHAFISDALAVADDCIITRGHVSIAIAQLREMNVITVKEFNFKRGLRRQPEVCGLNMVFSAWGGERNKLYPRRKLPAVPEQLAMEFDRWARASGQLEDELIKSFVEGLYPGLQGETLPSIGYIGRGGLELPLVSERGDARQNLESKKEEASSPVADSNRGPEGMPAPAATSPPDRLKAELQTQKREFECALLHKLKDALSLGPEALAAVEAEARMAAAKVTQPANEPQSKIVHTRRSLDPIQETAVFSRAAKAWECLEQLDAAGSVQKLSDPVLREQWRALCESHPDYVMGHLTSCWRHRAKQKDVPANPLVWLARVALNDGRLQPIQNLYQ